MIVAIVLALLALAMRLAVGAPAREIPALEPEELEELEALIDEREELADRAGIALESASESERENRDERSVEDYADELDTADLAPAPRELDEQDPELDVELVDHGAAELGPSLDGRRGVEPGEHETVDHDALAFDDLDASRAELGAFAELMHADAPRSTPPSSRLGRIEVSLLYRRSDPVSSERRDELWLVGTWRR